MKFSIKSEADGLALVEVFGDLCQKRLAASADPLEDLLGPECYGKRVLLDLHGLDTIDSSGVGWLLACQKKFRAAGGVLVLHSLAPFARDVMKILNMQLVFKMADDEATAIRLAQEDGR
jgi:anti-sigma B factor antagonist